MPSSPNPALYSRYFPKITFFLALWCVLAFLGLNLEVEPDTWEAMENWGAASPDRMRSGQWWVLFTSNLLHREWWHLLGNLIGLWLFGKAIEYEGSAVHYLVLIVVAAFCSSVYEMAISGSYGIGISGIVYAQFGYLWVLSWQNHSYRKYVNRNIVISLLGWLIACFFITAIGWINIANAAHVAGLLSGMLWAGLLLHARVGVRWSVISAMLLVSAVPLFWAPWSVTWLGEQAFELHEAERFDEAMELYRQILERDSGNVFAQSNMQSIEVYQLLQVAMEAHQQQDLEQAKIGYQKVLEIDPEDEIAQENILKIELHQLSQLAHEAQIGGRYIEALKLFNEILALDPENDWAKEHAKRVLELDQDQDFLE